MFYAVANRSKKIAKLIVDAGADVNLADTLGVTPLMMACLNKEKVVRACVRACVNPRLAAGAHRTLLATTCRCGACRISHHRCRVHVLSSLYGLVACRSW